MKQLIGILLIFGLFSCHEPQQPTEASQIQKLTSEQKESVLSDYNFQYESPIVLDSTNYILIPLSAEVLGSSKRISKDGYYSEEHPRYWNVLFHDRVTGENRLLSEEKIRISEIHTSQNLYQSSNEIMNQKVLYEIGDLDFNQDGKLTWADPEYLFASDKNGKNLTRISPLGEQLQSFEVIANSAQILFKTRRDSNQDLTFTEEDKSIWYKAELRKDEWKIEEIVDQENRKKIEELYFEQWLDQ